MSIQYTTNLTGQPIVEFNCPKCNLRLTASLTEAGTVEKCGECGGGFKVPGEERLEVYRAEQLQKKKLDFPLGTVVCFSVVMVGVYLLASLVVLPRTADPDFNFVDERGSVTALSAKYYLQPDQRSRLQHLYYRLGIHPDLVCFG